MAIRLLAVAAALGMLLAGGPPAVAAESRCKITGLAQLPVTMRGSRPLVAARINGRDVFFLVDSGAFYSFISPASAVSLDLPQTIAPTGFVVSGVGGQREVMIANVREFGLGGGTVQNMEFLVGGPTLGGADIVGVLGQNVFAFADAEFDIGDGYVRMFQMNRCKDAERAYWTKPGEKFSSISIQPIDKFASQVRGRAYLNGKRIRVFFDTGAPTSVVSLHAAERAGVRIGGAGVEQVGHMGGIGAQLKPVYMASFTSFRIGDQEIKDTRLSIADLDLKEVDMILGMDFFLSHRILISFSTHKLLFTYRGGPVFDLPRRGSVAASEISDSQAGMREPSDAPGFSRRAATYAARNDFERAIADMTRAIGLAPAEADYYYQRAQMYQGNRQSGQALNDLDEAIGLKAAHLEALIMRSGLRLARLQGTGQGNLAAIRADLAAARAVATPEADAHFEIGRLYAGIGDHGDALAGFRQWLELHGDDTRAADARAFACRSRAVLGEELPRALSDCNAAVRDRLGIPFPLEARGLVHVRMRNWDRALTDLNKVVEQQPQNAWALYARGLAKLGKGDQAGGEKDIAAARVANARDVSNAEARGFVPLNSTR